MGKTNLTPGNDSAGYWLEVTNSELLGGMGTPAICYPQLLVLQDDFELLTAKL